MLDATLIGKKIKSIREKQNMTQMEFCELINCTQAALSGYENGTKIPSIDTLYTISSQCSVSLDWLCGTSHIKSNTPSKFGIEDTIWALLLLTSCTDCYFEDRYKENAPFDGEYKPGLFFNDYKLEKFIAEWRKMIDLLNNKTIDDELYELWINKTIRNLVIQEEKENIKKNNQ